MTPQECIKKYTKIEKMFDKWELYLEIDHQGFCLEAGRTKKDLKWTQEQLGIALARMLEKNNGSE